MRFYLLILINFICFSAGARDAWPLYQNMEQNIWFILAAVFFFIEVGTGGIGLLFASIGALATGIFLAKEMITSDLNSQIVSFFSVSCLSAVILWKPLKSIRSKKSSYNSIVGQVAIVESEILNKNNIGSIKWSGAIINAKLDETSQPNEIAKDTEVTIVSVDKNIFYVTPK